MSKSYTILTGQKFGSWTVLDNTYRKNNHRYWTCQCECGNKQDIRADQLTGGKSKMCSTCAHRQSGYTRYDFTGQKFGALTLIERTPEGLWRCKCDCGNEIIVTTKYLKDPTGNPSCQDDYCPYNSYHGKSVKPGETYGRLTVIEKAEVKDGKQLWLCRCQCGDYVKRPAYKIKEGSCGCGKSQGETIISSILKNHNIIFTEQKTFDSCRFPDTKALAKFDFWVNDTYIIEFDGKQHFEYDNLFWNTKDHYEKTLEHDAFKNTWCKNNNIPLIRIPYTHMSKINIHDLLLDSTQFLI